MLSLCWPTMPCLRNRLWIDQLLIGVVSLALLMNERAVLACAVDDSPTNPTLPAAVVPGQASPKSDRGHNDSGDPQTFGQPDGLSPDEKVAGRTVSEWSTWFRQVASPDEAVQAAEGLQQLALKHGAPPALRRQATLMLAGLDGASSTAVATFGQLLKDVRPTATGEAPRSWGLAAIALRGAPAHELTPAIIEILHAPQTSRIDRLLAVEALACIGPADDQTLPVLLSVLEAGVRPSSDRPAAIDTAANLELQTAAAGLLGLFGRAAAPGSPALLRAARADHEPLRRAAIATLGTIADPAFLEPLTDAMLFDSSPAVQDAAAMALSTLGEIAVTPLRQLLMEPEQSTRLRGLLGLRMIGPAARVALSDLQSFLDSDSEATRLAAAEAVWSITSEVTLPLPVAADLLMSSDPAFRTRALRLLIEMGRETQSPALLAKLHELSESRDPRVRQAAYLALREIANRDPDSK